MWAQQYVSRRSKFQKLDRHRNWIEVQTVFDHFGWKGWRIVTPWMTARLTWSSLVYAGAPGYHTPKQITAFISINRPMLCLEMRLWVTQEGERLFGKSRDLGFQLSGLGFMAQGFPYASAHRRVVGVSTLGVFTASKQHEAGNRTSCNFLFWTPYHLSPFHLSGWLTIAFLVHWPV